MQQRQVTVRKGSLAENDQLDREFWLAVSPRDRLAAVWDLVAETLIAQDPDAGEPRLQRSVCRVTRHGC
jgi:hypothetical protein